MPRLWRVRRDKDAATFGRLETNMVWVKCEKGHKYEMYSGENKSCPQCGLAARGGSSNWIKCGACGTKNELHHGETKACKNPQCRRAISG